MKILLASDHYPPAIGGAQVQTQALARAISAAGHEVAVATVWQPGLPAHEIDQDIDISRLRQMRSFGGHATERLHQPPFPDPVTVVELRRLIRRFNPQILHTAGWFSYSAALALGRRPTPLVVSARDYGYSCAATTLLRDDRVCEGPGLVKCLNCAAGYYGRPKGWMAATSVLAGRSLLRNRVDALHSVSQYVDQVMVRDFIGDASPKREVIPSFLPDRRPGLPAEPDARLPEKPYMLFVGALRHVKGVETLLAAYARLSPRPPLVLIGTKESDTPPIPEGVVLLQDVPHQSVLAAWDRSLFGIMPSLWPEPFGSVVHEAMSRGKPVIGTKPGGHADIITEGVNGLLVPAGDVEGLAAAMAKLASDEEYRERLGRAAREQATAFGQAAVVPRFLRLYDELLTEAGTST